MNKNYRFLIILLLLLFSNGITAQILEEEPRDRLEDFRREDEFDGGGSGGGFDDIIVRRDDDYGNEVGDFSFGWGSIDAIDVALTNQLLLEAARVRALNAWYDRQLNEIIKPAIERKLNTRYPNFEQAKNALFLASENNNINENVNPLRGHYNNLKRRGYAKRREHVEQLKFLKIREAEIRAGNINSSQYPYAMVNGMYLKDITDINSFNQQWETLLNVFNLNAAETHANEYIYRKLSNMGPDFGNYILNLKNGYYNGFPGWDRLNLMQFLINYEEYKRLTSPPYYNPTLHELFYLFRNIDQATPEVIENYAINHREGGTSIFHPAYHMELAYIIGSGQISHIIIAQAWNITEQRRREALESMLDNVNTAHFALANLAGELNITNRSSLLWLYSENNRAKVQELVNFANNNRVNGELDANLKNFLLEAFNALRTGGSVDYEDKIIENLTGKAKCLNDYLNEQGNSFVKNILNQFRGESEFDIKIESRDRVFSENLNQYVNGTTSSPVNGLITILISTENLSDISALGSARTLIHEYIHADMYRKLNTKYPIQGDLDFKRTYEEFESGNFEASSQHETMAKLYVNSIKDALKNFHRNVLVGDYNYLTDNGANPLPDSFYEALA